MQSIATDAAAFSSFGPIAHSGLIVDDEHDDGHEAGLAQSIGLFSIRFVEMERSLLRLIRQLIDDAYGNGEAVALEGLRSLETRLDMLRSLMYLAPIEGHQAVALRRLILIIERLNNYRRWLLRDAWERQPHSGFEKASRRGRTALAAEAIDAWTRACLRCNRRLRGNLAGLRALRTPPAKKILAT